MDINIDFDEWYPVYYFYKIGDRWFRKDRPIYNIPASKVVELEEIFKKFDEAQTYLREKYEKI